MSTPKNDPYSDSSEEGESQKTEEEESKSFFPPESFDFEKLKKLIQAALN